LTFNALSILERRQRDVCLWREPNLTITARRARTVQFLHSPLGSDFGQAPGQWTIVAIRAGDDVVRAEPFAEVEFELASLGVETDQWSAAGSGGREP
jgi:hypothetical protein